MTENELTHDKIIARAVHWLRHSHKCPVVLVKPRCMLEIPDVVGFKSADSFLVSAKTDREEFEKHLTTSLVDKFPMISVGNYRFFVTPPYLVEPEEVPDYWGLAYVYPKIIRTVKHAYRISEPYEMVSRERAILYWGLRRAQAA